jgi:hypothetical protein
MKFESLPVPCLVMAITCVRTPSFLEHFMKTYMIIQLVNCLHEYQSGSHSNVNFTGQAYNKVYDQFWNLVAGTLKNRYHGKKLHKLLRRISEEG